MTLIYRTENFIAEAVDKNPHITREDGGHIKISPKIKCSTRQDLSSKLLIEMSKIICLVGETMTIAMNKIGIDIGRINYQDNGNWGVFKSEGPHLHIHLYGRAKSAKFQKYGEACYFPHIQDNSNFYKKNEPLNEKDISQIKEEIKKLLKTEKYSNEKWKVFCD